MSTGLQTPRQQQDCLKGCVPLPDNVSSGLAAASVAFHSTMATVVVIMLLSLRLHLPFRHTWETPTTRRHAPFKKTVCVLREKGDCAAYQSKRA